MLSERTRRLPGHGLLLVLSMLPFVTLLGQSDPEVNALDGYLSGRRFLVSYRDGGPVYGSHIFLDVHYCSNGQYLLAGESRRQTVLDNWQINRWEDSGQWTVLRVDGRTGVRAVSRSGKIDFVVTELLADGRLWVGDGVSVNPKGPAICR